jgi:hypothetical protein
VGLFSRMSLAVPAACTNLTTKPSVVEAGVRVLDQPVHAAGKVATAGGCLAAQYLAAWIILRGASQEDAETALQHVAPVDQKAEYVIRAIETVMPYLPRPAVASAA